MIIRSKNFVLKLEEILIDNLPTERYNEHENIALKIIRKWCSDAEFFTHQTSGSTGRPKKVKIGREKIEISTRATMSEIDPTSQIKTSLLCLDPQHIGGAMVIYRGLLYDHDITIVEPSSNPMVEFPDKSFDLASMVPMQFQNLTERQINRVRVILIGGAPVEVQENSSSAKIYSTFGMTETVSHIALRPLNEEVFKTTGDTIVDTYDDQLLKIKGAITDHKWLKTNDKVSLISKKSFKWIGRNDFLINTGGVKVSPETIEAQLKDKVIGTFMIGSVPDKELGQKVVLIAAGDEQIIDFGGLKKYEKPKTNFFNRTIYHTPNGKIDRKKTQEEFNESI